LTIAVQRDDNLAASMVEPGHHRSSLTEIPLKMDHANALILVSELLQDFIGRISAAVVYKDQFPSDSDLGQFAAYTLADVDQRVSFIENRDNDRNINHLFRPWRPIFEKFCHSPTILSVF
jgi:hypothetical protein